MAVNDIKNQALEQVVGRRGATPDLEQEFWRNIAAGQGGTGARGAAGPQGPKGDTGPIGPKGDKGDKGDPLTPTDIFNAENRGVYTGTGSLKNLGEGWWYVTKDQAGITGRPSGSAGDLLVYRRQIGTDGVALLAFGRDREGPQVWGEYRAADNIGYSPWIKLSVTDTLSLDQIKAELIKEGWGPLPGGGTPVVPLVKYYAGYDTVFPTHLSELAEYSTTKFTITRQDTTAERIFILVDKVHASQVAGFIISGGVQAVWNFRDTVIDGTEYRAFYSPGAYYELSDTVEIKFL